MISTTSPLPKLDISPPDIAINENEPLGYKIGLVHPGQPFLAKNLVRFANAIQVFDTEQDADEWLRLRSNVFPNFIDIVKVRLYIYL